MSEWTELLREKARAALPLAEGGLRADGLHEPVEVVWDRWGVPHIYAEDLHDLYFAQGFVMGSQRLFQLDLMLRLAGGRLAEMFGDMALPMDRFCRTVGWNRSGARLAETWDELSWEMSEAYAGGLRAWIEAMPSPPVEYEVLGLDPSFPEGRELHDLAAATVVFRAWTLSGNWEAELLRATIADRFGWDAMAALFQAGPQDPPLPGTSWGHRSGQATLELLRQAPATLPTQGSNAWVVAGRRTSTGLPLLANDPHLTPQVPSIWFEAHLSAPGIDVAGVTLPFAQGIVVGHNDRIAWGVTNVGGDTQDLYLERLNDEGTAALYAGAWEPLTIHREEISVRGRSEAEVLEVKQTRHGPILNSYLVGMGSPRVVEGGVQDTYALRLVGLEGGIKGSTLHRLNTARDFSDFRAAVEEWVSPGQHFVYADTDGNIGYQCTGLHPIRRKGDGTVPVPGWTADYEWDGYIPFEEMPWSLNPEEGFLVTANNKPHDDSYPYLLGKDLIAPYRARRIAELVTQKSVHDLRSFADIQMDTVSLPSMEVVHHLLGLEPADDRQKQALALLADWTFDLAADSPAAALYEVWSCRIADAVLLPRLGRDLFDRYYGTRQWAGSFRNQVLPALLAHPTAAWFGKEGAESRDALLRRALDAALEELTASMGEDAAAWAWGRLHRVRFQGQLSIMPDLADLFAGGEAAVGGGEDTVLQSYYEPGASYQAVIVPSWRQIIDLSDFDRSQGVHPPGQSGNLASGHYNDSFPLWSEGRHHPLPFTRAAVEEATESTLRLSPGQSTTVGG